MCKTRISEATQHELEFYMCMYLHFHAVSHSQSSEPDPTEWKCNKATCQFDNLDVRIAEQESVISVESLLAAVTILIFRVHMSLLLLLTLCA